MSVNSVNISGNLGRDIEVRSTAGGTMVGTFSLAVNGRKRNPSTGEYDDYTHWVNVVVFDKSGKWIDYLSRNLTKGSHAEVSGKLNYSAWEKDGVKHSKLEVVADEIDFDRSKGQSYIASDRQSQGTTSGIGEHQSSQQKPSKYQQPAYQQQQQPAQEPYQQELPQPELAESDPFGSDIPF